MHWMLMPLRRYAEFSGRSRRMEFWMWQLFKFLVGCGIWIVFLGLFGGAMLQFGQSGDPSTLIAASAGLMMLWLLMMVLGLAIIIPDIAVSVRRLHDTDRSGWWILAPVVPYLLVWGVLVSSFSIEKPAPPTGLPAILIFGGIAAAGILALTLLVFYFLDGTPGPNRFGPDPKGRDA